MPAPLISIIMPSFNHAQYLKFAIESVLTQTMNDWELIIVDDASKDSSQALIKEYCARDSRLKPIFHEHNKGIAITMNEGISVAKGQYISMIASDDMWREDKLGKQLKLLQNNEDRIVWSDSIIIDSNGINTGQTFIQKYRARTKKKSGMIFDDLLEYNYICALTLMGKREIFAETPYSPEYIFLNDYKFAVDAAAKYKYLYSPETLAMYRVHNKNSVIIFKKECSEENLRLHHYFLHTYARRLSPKAKGAIYLALANQYFLLKRKKEAFNYIHDILKTFPLFVIKASRAFLIFLIRTNPLFGHLFDPAKNPK